MRLLYTMRCVDFPSGFAVRHPRYFVKPEAGVEHVSIEGDFPVIAEAYEALGVPVETIGGNAAEAIAVPELAISDADKAEAETVVLDQPVVKELDDMTVDELQAYLTELGVEFDPKAKKADLLKLAKEQ
ncbi:hypothetical protein PAEH1_01465 [Paenalcaligenes hominis]|uniref:HeH/LEM domain-containing protein n=1 Tax=Paenalcaligenes hominis TaxID=643674 RepID=A0A1U9JXN6_9BURK|nr:HeH/LEM domain-containing protein [Paenalcaligenes hominis]AQS50547.1 hypothetical protein PAEH1_01465 [Paenalcaligenes hominis]